jgi:hypothetical protein
MSVLELSLCFSGDDQYDAPVVFSDANMALTWRERIRSWIAQLGTEDYSNGW